MINVNCIFPLGKIPHDKKAGGKAMSLSLMLENIKVEIPYGYVMTSDAFDNGAIKNDALEELKKLVGTLDEKHTFAVRSSALNEDGENASFAGQYETITNVKKENIISAVKSVISSAKTSRVKEYSESFNTDDQGIAVVIQKFVVPTFAGVVFTSDPLTGKDDKMTGNLVRGDGEDLVSGNKNADVFYIGTSTNFFEGPEDFKKYAKELGSYCTKIRRFYGMPMDIEWAVSEGKVYILQARPITTLRRINLKTYEVNGSMSGHKLLTRTNVGEIFMKPVTPMTYSVLEKINDMLGLPDWLDNICGQPYMNISILCSIQMALGRSEKASFETIKELVGNVPDGVTVPVSYFDKKAFLKKMKELLFPKNRSKLKKKEKLQMVEDLFSISDAMIKEIKNLSSNDELFKYWNDVMLPKLNDGLASIMTASGTALVPLLSMRKKIEKIAGEDMANRLCGGCVGTLASMKPLLLIEDVIAGKITREEYIETCGHRCANEMELSEPRPYEDPAFPDGLIEEHKRSGVNLHEMQKKQQQEFAKALREFKETYPSKSKWIDKQIGAFTHANDFREDIRSKGVKIFCVFREFILRAGELNGLGDDIFLLYYQEMFDLLKGDKTCLENVAARKDVFEKYQEYPAFPSLILGRFNPEEWLKDPDRRNDFYSSEKTSEESVSSDVKGFPGAAGTVTGNVRVITDFKDIDLIQKGEVLVTVATNVGWTVVFPKVSAIVTDIGAPLSHAAIVAREFGIPAVVGCGNATTVLKTGDKVVVDGANGTVKLVEITPGN